MPSCFGSFPTTACDEPCAWRRSKTPYTPMIFARRMGEASKAAFNSVHGRVSEGHKISKKISLPTNLHVELCPSGACLVATVQGVQRVFAHRLIRGGVGSQTAVTYHQGLRQRLVDELMQHLLPYLAVVATAVLNRTMLISAACSQAQRAVAAHSEFLRSTTERRVPNSRLAITHTPRALDHTLCRSSCSHTRWTSSRVHRIERDICLLS